MKVKIKENERGLLFKDGTFLKALYPGKHLFWGGDYSVKICNVENPFDPEFPLEVYLRDRYLAEELEIFEIADNEMGILYRDKHYFRILSAGQHAFWKVFHKYELVKFNTLELRVDPEHLKQVPANYLTNFIQIQEIKSYEKGVLFIDGKMSEVLEAGKYWFWKNNHEIKIEVVDQRQLQIDLTGQEILTQDKVTLRLNFVVHYHINSPETYVVKVKNPTEQLYVLAQLILREYIGTYKLDEFLSQKQTVGEYVLQKLKTFETPLGIEFNFAGIKDIILPGDIKQILNEVILAEKKAQANIITRREEVASTRCLLNTAKLMEENPILFRLKELETLEKMMDKISQVTFVGGDSLLSQMKRMLETPS